MSLAKNILTQLNFICSVGQAVVTGGASAFFFDLVTKLDIPGPAWSFSAIVIELSPLWKPTLALLNLPHVVSKG